MSNALRQRIIARLNICLGDDLERAVQAFREYSPAEMDEPHGFSGKTRAEVLQAYKNDRQRHLEEIAYMENI